MKLTGTVYLPLHSGRAPKWLFGRMVKLAGAISETLVLEYGQKEFLQRISDPFWFQCLTNVIGFDWHSSGTTTVTCGALKEAFKSIDIGIEIAGGKGATSRKTPEEIVKKAELFSLSTKKIDELQYSSKMAAKIDSAALQDNYILYHHVFIFSEHGDWSVIQQGMNKDYARRYHWLSSLVKEFVEEPHNAICSQHKEKIVLNMVAKQSKESRKTSLDLLKDNPEHLKKYFRQKEQSTLEKYMGKESKVLCMPASINWKAVKEAYDVQPKNYEHLLSLKGIGPGTVRALALISELIYGTEPSWKDPVKYSFAVGGKDGVPYPVNREQMDETIQILKNAIQEAKINNKEKLKAIRRLNNFLHY